MLAAARISAAIEILDRALGGTPLDPALTTWGRANRFAGSGDRAAIRDLVFDAWRCRLSFAALGGAETGRGLMLGYLRASGQDPSEVFNGLGHAPAMLSYADAPLEPGYLAALDCPDWLAPRLQTSLGADFAPVMRALQHRAPVFLRVNLARTSRDHVATLLAAEGIETRPHLLAIASLEVLISSRKLMTTQAYIDGLFELQDAASQAVIEAIPDVADKTVLDFCAGGGGKALALAARGPQAIWAYDVNPARMRDLPERAKRAQASIGLLADPTQHAPFDLVVADAPCSGSGSWRRDPQGKWALTAARLADLQVKQTDVLTRASALVARDGRLAYATCSLLAQENEDAIARFLLRSPDWHALQCRHFTPLQGGDGFFLAILTRET